MIYILRFDLIYIISIAVVYGQGVYFALNCSYSHNYTSGENTRKMLRSKVLVGACTVGTSSMKVPPAMHSGELFDSTGDRNNTIFVCYHDNQCYPEYIISYL